MWRIGSDNLIGADNQQERLDAYNVSHDPERRQVLDLLMQRLACGRIQVNHRESVDNSLVYVVRRRGDLVKSIR